LTAEIHREGEWFVALCPEMPEANGQGRTQEEAVQSLREAILLLLADRRADSLKQRQELGLDLDAEAITDLREAKQAWDSGERGEFVPLSEL
jgi:predicted RNase H-like HicB family nuclease